MPKENLKDKLDGKELDLSLSNLTTVPVKEIAALPKATHLDLSCNQITSLPDNFCTLTNLVKLDLSKNSLTFLPRDIGNLARLQYLDLFNNQIHMLPVSFWQLKSLKWLDLKDNPLDETLKSIAGDCLDDTQCKKCAKQVLLYMKTLESEQERQKQRHLQEEREKDAAKKVEEEKEKQMRKAEKLAEKERRRKEFQAAQERKMDEESHSDNQQQQQESKLSSNGTPSSTTSEQTKENKNVGLSCFGVLLTAMIGLVAIIIGLYFYCDNHTSDPLCNQGKAQLYEYYSAAQQLIKKYTQS